MAKKRKRARRAKKSNPTRKRSHARKKRHARRNPRHVRVSRAYRSRARRSGSRVSRRKYLMNPSKRRHRRSRRRNPGEVMSVVGGVAAAAGAYLATQAIGYMVTTDQVADGARNRGIVGAVLGAAGLYAAHKGHVGLGLGLAAGAVLGAFGGQLTTQLFAMLPAKPAATTTKGLAAVVYDNFGNAIPYTEPMMGMGGYQQQLNGYQQQLSAVVYDNFQGMGDTGFMPPPPWESPAGPFGYPG